MRIVFMGSPDFAIPSLNALHDTFQIASVVTQPDRPAGRGRELRFSPVKQRALELSLPILQPPTLKEKASVDEIRALAPDVIVVAAFGQILPPNVLDLPHLGCINVHASLLPRWRGAAPVQAAIYHGDRETGVTIMKMDPSLDTGPILMQRSTSILPNETGGQLTERLSVLGAELLVETLPMYVQGEIDLRPQDNEAATQAPMLKKSDGKLDFGRDAPALERQVRAYEPWPSSFFMWKKRRIVVRRAHAAEDSGKPPGTTFVQNDKPAIATASDALILDVVQPAGKRRMDGRSFLLGAQDFPNTHLS
jgi:methionyl-tRNA formyltransferase